MFNFVARLFGKKVAAKKQEAPKPFRCRVLSDDEAVQIKGGAALVVDGIKVTGSSVYGPRTCGSVHQYWLGN